MNKPASLFQVDRLEVAFEPQLWVFAEERRGEIERQLARGEQLLAQRPEGRSRILPGHWRDALPPNGSRGQLKVL